MLDIVERAEFVYTSRVVFVVVCKQYRIQMVHIFAQRLHTEVGTCIDDYRKPFILHESGRAQPLVAGIRRLAYGAVASYHRHAL